MSQRSEREIEQQLKGKRYNCALCGKEGIYGEDLMRRLGINNAPKASAEIVCKDYKACRERRRNKR